MKADWLADLNIELPQGTRLQRLVNKLQIHLHCDAVALLKLENTYLQPVTVVGLSRDALGRRFIVGQHPRLASILAHTDVTHFRHDSPLPDPYDGLIDKRAGEPLPVHGCMGISLHINQTCWGVLTLDTLDIDTFNAGTQEKLRQLAPFIEAIIRVAQLESEIGRLRVTYGSFHNGNVIHLDNEIIGQSEAIGRLLHELTVVADSGLPVLLLGETGVGKELFAHRIHRLSRRHKHALVHVNCAALPESLAESELFGHAKGSFSGAINERPGRFDTADGGTLFLDEVGELPLTVQAKLLRVLQNGEIQRLGTDQPRHVDVRVIAATNRNLRSRVSEGAFRADLYHRLSVYPIPIPPLRERDNDVLLLAGRFLELNRARLGLRSLRLSATAQDALYRYSWPGNVRELEHTISRAALKAISRGVNRNDIVTLEVDLLDLDELALPAPSPLASGTSAIPLKNATLREATESCQRQLIQQALLAHSNNWAQTARQLGMDPSNLHKLGHRLKIKA